MKDELAVIQQRNQTKELDKAWENSWTRKIVIALITYVSALLFLWVIAVPDPYYAALVPVGGFLLSTLTLKPLKKWWVNQRLQN